MAAFLLDTNIVSYLVDTRAVAHAMVRERLAGLADDDTVSISILTLYELHHWMAHDEARRGLVQAVVKDFAIEPLTTEGAAVFANLVSALRDRHGASTAQRAGIDCMIAATALVLDSVIVSNDGLFVTLAELEPKLRLANWAGEASA